MCPSSLSLSLILSFFKSSSHLIAIYNTHTHKVLLLLVVVARTRAHTHTRARARRRKEKEREREREFVFFQPQNATAKRSTLIYTSRKKKLSSLFFKRVVSVTHEKKEDIKFRVSFKKKNIP